MAEHENDQIERVARELRRPVAVSALFDARVMAAVRALPVPARIGVWARLITPRTVTVMPLRWGLLAASVAAFALVGAVRASRATKPEQRVQFVLVAPDAKKVSVVGDFNGWDASHASFQAQHRGGGVWSVTVPVAVGHHRYSFVVDDSLWVADPSAARVADNDFGMPNSAIVVQEQ